MKYRIISFIIVSVFAFSCFSGCAGGSKKTDGTESDAVTVRSPELTSITAEGYSIDFDPRITEYTVLIPDGRPTIPRVTAQGDSEVSVTQAVIADGEKNGTAVIRCEKDGQTGEYRVTFIKDASMGYYLQYADVIRFKPGYKKQSGEKFEFSSSAPDVIKIDSDGYAEAVGISDQPVILTAKIGGNEVDSLTVDKVIKAPINIFLIIGQSNAFGWHDLPEGESQAKYFRTQREKYDKPLEGTVWADEISTSYDTYKFSGMVDLTSSKKKGFSGFFPALGKEWYARTGEKTLMLKTAVGSSPIEAWTPDENLLFYSLDLYGITKERFSYYVGLFSADDSMFTLNRVFAYWLQGETCQEYNYSPAEFKWDGNRKYRGDWVAVTKSNPPMNADTYYSYFMEMYDGFVKDIGLEFMGILPVRSMKSVSSKENLKTEQLVDLVAPRAAQFALNYTDNGNIAIVTLETEIGRTEAYSDKDAQGWGYLGCNNIHYQQIGYNAIGKDAACNTFRMLYASDRNSEDIRILDSNGSSILNDGDTIRIESGKTHQITAIAMPVYTDASALQFNISDTSVCTIDKYGMLTASADGSAIGKTVILTVSNGTVSKTISIVIA
ncbi:MAG: hypothetical protein J5563_04555 [Clostridia bacterium]|nr:hypothetical protein [Clostridia bacterium]